MYGVIYKLTNKINGKPYVGQTTRTPEERFIDHKYCQTSNIGRAIRKYGEENFTIEVLEECETKEQLNEREIFWIAFFNCMVPNGYNVAEGGQGNWERTPESIAKMSRKGKHHTEESKAKIAASLMGDKNPNFGKPKTDEERAKLSAATKNKRPVICVETGEVFESMTAAARAKQVTVQDISRACKNPGRTAGGCHWRIADEPQSEISADRGKTTSRPVICVETGEIFESLNEVGRQYYISSRCIARACGNPAFTSCGCHWRFADEEN